MSLNDAADEAVRIAVENYISDSLPPIVARLSTLEKYPGTETFTGGGRTVGTVAVAERTRSKQVKTLEAEFHNGGDDPDYEPKAGATTPSQRTLPKGKPLLIQQQYHWLNQ